MCKNGLSCACSFPKIRGLFHAGRDSQRSVATRYCTSLFRRTFYSHCTNCNSKFKPELNISVGIKEAQENAQGF
jgi:hypothetical protein